MADFVFNASKGRAAQFAQDAIDTAAKVWMLALKASVADATAKDYDDVAAMLGDASTTEADFTNYARIDVTANLARTLDDTDDEMEVDVTVDPNWDPAGGASNNNLTDVVFYYDPTGAAADNACIPISQHDFVVTTDGNKLTVQVHAEGFYAGT